MEIETQGKNIEMKPTAEEIKTNFLCLLIV